MEPTSSRLSPARRAVLGVGLMAALPMIGYGALNIVSLTAHTSYERHVTLPASGGRLTIDDGAGNVRVVAGPTDDVRVTNSVRAGLFEPTITETAGPAGVRLAADCHGWVGYCRVNLTVTVPATFAVTVGSGDGDVTVDGVDGTLAVHSSSGTVRVTGGSLDVNAASSAGGVYLTFATPPDRVVATTSAGRVWVAVPRAPSGYRVNAQSSGGQVRIAVPTDPAGLRTIDASSSAGDVDVVLTGR